jgi:RNA polymerase sigma factor (sigma-70 family)
LSTASLFEQIILPHLNAAYNLARWLTRNEQDAEDVVQEAYLRAFRFFDGFKGGDGRVWLLAIVRNTCVTWRRKETQIAKVPFDEETHGPNEMETTVEGRLAGEVNLEQLRSCLESLPLEYREILVMRELEELPYKDIGEILSLPIGTVMSRLSRGRKRLQDCVVTRVKGVAG